MRNIFPEFNKPTPKGFKKIWKESIFVFDTNVLLSLYRIPQQAREKMISILKELQKKDKIWIPHQVAREFYCERMNVIHIQEKAHRDIIELLEKTEQEINKKFDSKEILKKISGSCKIIKNEIEKSKLKNCDWLKKDKVEIELNRILKDKVGRPYDKNRINEIYQEGQERYNKEIPPGYEDKKKDKDDKTGTKKFGDLLIWFQIIDRAKEIKKPIIFITDEQKEDWWWKINSNTIIGPRHELTREIKDQSGAIFYMYQSEQFMKHVGEYFKVKFGKDLIEQVRKVKEITQSDQELAQSSEGGLSVSSADRVGSNEVVKNAPDVSAQEGNVSLDKNNNPADTNKVDDNQAKSGTK